MTDAPESKADLREAHPEVDERYLRMGALLVRITEARRAGGGVPPDAVREAADLAAWARALVGERAGDPAAFAARVDRDRTAFALGLRLAGEEQVLSQLLAAAADLERVVDGRR